jgi:hypothetical protein
MSLFDLIPLNREWSLHSPENGLSMLVDLPHHLLIGDIPASLQKTFDLDPIGEVCLRFVLHIAAAPAGTVVNVNRWEAGITQDQYPFAADVTDYVTLEYNVLILKLRQGGRLGAMWLERLPCE